MMAGSGSSYSLEDEHSEQTLGSTTRSSRNRPVAVTKQHLSDVEETPPEPDLLRFLLALANHDYPIVPQSALHLDASTKKSSGAFGEVARATWVQDDGLSKVVAVKRFHRLDMNAADNSEEQKSFRRALYDLYFELEIMGRSSSPNVAKVLAISFQENDDEAQTCTQISPVLILDPADFSHPDLSKYFETTCRKRPVESSLFSIFTRGIALGLHALHRLGVVHADLKPANILLFRHEGELVPKLTDFGLSGITASGETPRGGTREWNAPECLPRVEREVSIKASLYYRDIYSFGLVVAYMLRDGKGPFASNVDDRDRIKRASEDAVFEHVWSLVTPQEHSLTELQLLNIQEILNLSLKKTPEARSISLQSLAQQLTEPKSTFYTRWGIFARKKPPTLASHTPFGSTKITEMVNLVDPLQLFAVQDLAEFTKAPKSLPQSFLNALSNQLARVLSNMALPELQSAWTILATHFIQPNDLESVFAARPEVRAEYEEMLEKKMMYLSGTILTLLDNSDPEAFVFEILNAFVSLKPSKLHFILAFGDAKSLKSAMNDLRNGINPELNKALVIAQMEELKECLTLSKRAAFLIFKSGKLPHFNLAQCGTESLTDVNWEVGDQFEAWGWTLLHSAVLFNNTKAVEILLKQGVNVNAQLNDTAPLNWTPMHVAVVFANERIISLLLKVMDIDLWVPDRKRFAFTVAHYAAEFRKDANVLLALLDHDPNLVVARDFRKRTPLHRAVGTGRLPLVKILIARGADINAKDATGNTPLHKAYAAANGLQGAASAFGDSHGLRQQSIVNSATVSGEYSRIWASALQDLSSQTSFSSAIGHNLEMVQAYEALVKTAPDGHDVFQYLPLGFNRNLDIVTNTICASLRQSYISMTTEQFESQHSHIKPIPTLEDIKEVELNITEMVNKQRRHLQLMTDSTAPGQQGVTYMRDEAGRNIVYYLLAHGASPTILSKTGYSPECFAYSPSNLFWTASFDFDNDTVHKPDDAWFKGSSTLLCDDQPDRSSSALYLKPLHGDFTIWKWLQGVIPAPAGLDIIVYACRCKSDLDEDERKLDDFDLIVEARMYPPNDAGNIEQQLLHQKYKIRDILPEQDTMYSVRLGSIPLKHKCDLLINFRSYECSHRRIGGLMLLNWGLTDSTKRGSSDTSPFSSKELGIVKHDVPECYGQRHLSGTFHEYPMETFKTPKTFWHGPPPRAKERPFISSKSNMDIHTADPLFYTRKRLGLRDDGKPLYGARMWHYKEKRGFLNHAEMRAKFATQT